MDIVSPAHCIFGKEEASWKWNRVDKLYKLND